jgi:glycosyltransferase involved in cell wall biosynthesis
MGFERNEISVNANGGTELMLNLLEKYLDKDLLENFQIVFSRHRETDNKKIRIFQAHDLPEDPESSKFRDEKFLNSFHKILFVSNWQYQRYQLFHNLPYTDKYAVIDNGIEPAPQDCLNKPTETIRLVYTSTPQRGLEILVPVFKLLAEKYDNIHLDVFSSFKIYGWDDADKNFEPLYKEIKDHPKMTYHGFVPNEKLKEHLKQCHIFAYPSIWLETSCRSMLEAMSAGLICVHPNYGALPETSGGLNIMYQGDFQNKNIHASIFANHLNAAIEFVKTEQSKNMISFNKTYVDGKYNMERISSIWNMTLRSLLNQYPKEESREIKEIFSYKTT